MSSTRTASTFSPPVMEARRWIEGVTFPPERPLINVSQAAPVDPPPAPLREAMARIVMEDASAHLYGPVLGLPELRAAGRELIAVSLHLRPGNSGGPLMDAAGRLVGINTMMIGPEVGLAVPVHTVKRFLASRLGRGSFGK